MERFEILPGLPPYGPLAKPFPADGPHYSEGFVVRFFLLDGTNWVGNFRLGCSGCNAVQGLIGEKLYLIVSNGAGYIVDIESASLVAEVGDSYVHTVLAVPDLGLVVSGGQCNFQAIGIDGQQLWESAEVSFDGMRNVALDGSLVKGEGSDPDDVWYPFQIDLTTEEVFGGAYQSPAKQVRT